MAPLLDLPPSARDRLAREAPAYVLMKLRNALGRRVNLPDSDEPRRILLIPGLMANPSSMGRLRRSLSAAGCEVYDWGLGRNLGFRPEMLGLLEQRLRGMTADGRQVTLVGWSLGGLIARELAKCHPSRIARVVTLGSPFSGDVMANNNAVRTYRLLAGHAPCDVPQAASLAEKPPVPTIALWSRRDGVVAPAAACGGEAESDQRIEVHCAHMSFASCPDAIRATARAIGLDSGEAVEESRYRTVTA